jgi:pantoate kinase
MQSARAYSPGHITAFFKIYKNGSTGAGINVSDGVITQVNAKKSSENKAAIFINGKKSTAQTSKEVIEQFAGKSGRKFNLKIKHTVKLPIGYGLGLSGAGALSLAIALDKIYGTNYSREQLRKIATHAEVKCGTGLGDVTAELYAGAMMGAKPYPSKKVMQIKTSKKFIVLGFFAPIETRKIIRSHAWKKKVNALGMECMEKLGRKRNFEQLILCARYFTAELGLAHPKILRLMDECPDAAQSMLGQTAFALTNNPSKITRIFRKYTKNVSITRIAGEGAALLK